MPPNDKRRRALGKILKRARARTREAELRTGIAPQAAAPAKAMREVVEYDTPLRGTEAAQFAAELDDSPDKLTLLAQAAYDRDYEHLNRVLAEASYEYFAPKYLPGYFTYDLVPRFHGRLFPVLRAVEYRTTTNPVVVVGWRECGKTVCGTIMMPIHATIFGHHVVLPDGRIRDMSKRYVAIVSVVRGNAAKTVMSIMTEFRENDAIRRDFGEHYWFPGGRHPDPGGKTLYRSANGVFFEAKSRRSPVRGSILREYRLDLAIIDDIEDPDRVRKREHREADMKWLTETVLPAVSVDRGNAILNGNLMHPSSMASKLLEYGGKHGWPSVVFRVKDTDPETGEEVYTWPERFGPEFEKRKREELIFAEAYEQEYQQRPSAGNIELSPQDIGYYDYDEFSRTRLPYCEVYTAWDPAAGDDATRGDYTAGVTIAFDPADGVRYVLPAYHRRGVGLLGKVAAIVDEYIKWRPVSIGIESVAFAYMLREAVDEEARKRGLTLPTESIKQEVIRKALRIRRLYGPIKRRTLLFIQDDPIHRIMIDQAINIDTADHDDLADALEMADRLKGEEAARRMKNYGFVRARSDRRKNIVRKGDVDK